MPIYRYRCTEQVTVCPYCGDIKKDEHDYRGCCGESCAHFEKQACGNEYEVFYLSVSKVADEEPKEACPACGGTEKERLISQGTSHILKGKGWYKDGY